MNISKKEEVHDFWNDSSCGEALYLNSNKKIIPLEFEVSKDSYWVMKRNPSQVKNDFLK